jgi:hypothetical protein
MISLDNRPFFSVNFAHCIISLFYSFKPSFFFQFFCNVANKLIV